MDMNNDYMMEILLNEGTVNIHKGQTKYYINYIVGDVSMKAKADTLNEALIEAYGNVINSPEKIIKQCISLMKKIQVEGHPEFYLDMIQIELDRIQKETEI